MSYFFLFSFLSFSPFFFFFFNDTATTEIYTLSLHDALPIFDRPPRWHPSRRSRFRRDDGRPQTSSPRSDPRRPSPRRWPPGPAAGAAGPRTGRPRTRPRTGSPRCRGRRRPPSAPRKDPAGRVEDRRDGSTVAGSPAWPAGRRGSG